MTGKALTVSIVIPVYNEEEHIGDCLEAIQHQTEAPDEVILVDNNSTDNSIAIARQYPFVTVIQEKAQGRIPARNRGFAVATGDILGRIDADSVLASDWVARIRRAFQDSELWGITGLGRAIIDPHLPRLISTYWSRMYFMQMQAYFRAPQLWGANMAITRRAWGVIEAQACSEDMQVHEDQDLALLIAAKNGKIVLDPQLLVTVDGEQFAYLPKALDYLARLQRTRTWHKQQGTLALAQAQNTIPLWQRTGIRLLLLPILLMYGVLSGIFSLQAKLGLGELPQQKVVNWRY